MRYRETPLKPLQKLPIGYSFNHMNSTRTLLAALLIAASLVSFTTQTTIPVMPPRIEIEA